MRRDATASTAGSTTARLGALLALASAFLLCAFVPAAVAAPEATPAYAINSFGSEGAAPGQFASPTRIAVEPPIPAAGEEPEVPGNVLVVDSGNGRIQVFAPQPLGTYLTSIDTAGTPFGIAIDQGNGDVYVSETGPDRIVRYTSDGAPTPTYTLDPSFVSPAQGAGAGQVGNFASPIAVDPMTHDLLVADKGNKRVSRYTATGSFVSSFDGGPALIDLAVGPGGDVYVVSGVPNAFRGTLTPTNNNHVGIFAADGSPKGSLSDPSMPRPQSVAVDPGSGDVLVVSGGTGQFGETSVELHIFDEGVHVLSLPFPEGAERSPAVGVATDSGSSHRIFALMGVQDSFCCGKIGSSNVQVVEPSAMPGVELQPVSEVTQTSVHLDGAVDPGGQTTSAHFEYSLDGGTTWVKTPDQELAAKTGVQPVAADVTELAPNTEYQLRLWAGNPAGLSNTSSIEAFSTEQAPPAVVTDPANHIAPAQATLNGKITPFGLQTTYGFEYGETAAYGNIVPLGAGGVAGNGRVPRSFSRVVSGLSPETTYHFRLVASSAAGTTAGEDEVFTTGLSSEEVSCPNAALRTGLSAALPECRAYEQVSPVDKGGAIIAELYGFQARPDGGGVVYTTRSPSPDVESTVRFTRYASMRSAQGWSTRPIDPPTKTEIFGYNTYLGQVTLAVSEDLSKSFVVSTHALAAGGVEDTANLYVRDLQAGTYAFVANSSESSAFESFVGYSGAGEFNGGASDFSWIVFTSRMPLLPEASYNQAYRWSATGGLELLSRLPGGVLTGAPTHMGQEGFPRLPVVRFTSDDGNEIAFALESGGAGVDGAYLWKEGVITAISVSQVEGGPSGPQPAYITGMSRDGRYVTFLTYGGPPLTSDATEGVAVYRFDVVTENLEYLGKTFTGSTSPVMGVAAVSEDGNHVYFQDSPWLSVWSQGTVRQIAEAQVGSLTGDGASPDGRYFAYEHGGEVYLYDADKEELSCVSCPTDDSKSLGGHLPEGELNPGHTYPQLVTDQGQVFFNTLNPLVPSDVNGRQDVYMFSGGNLRLISPGTGNFKASLAGLSADGQSAFFFTDQPIVAQDRDGGATDVYDARVNGGIASQMAEPVGECAGDNCRGPVLAAPPPIAVRSEPTTGPRNSSGRARGKCGKAPRKRSKGKARCAKPHKQHTKRRQAR
ncbi:MAG TPA: hypothetical protein VGC49_10165 [Solirubrobacterales bacterium]